MEKEDFNLGDYNYEITVDDIRVEINKDNMNEKTVAYANEILNLYISKKKEIIDYILNECVLDFYESRFSKEEIIKRLHEADIKVISDNWGTLTWLNHELDEHIISVEFNDDMQLSYVSIDG